MGYTYSAELGGYLVPSYAVPPDVEVIEDAIRTITHLDDDGRYTRVIADLTMMRNRLMKEV